MRKLILALILSLLPISALAYHLPPQYQAVYCYPSGTYWQNQISHYPDYYAVYGSYYNSLYGPGTIYCP